MARKIITVGTLEAKRTYTSKKTGEMFYYYSVLVSGDAPEAGALPESAALLSVPFPRVPENDFNYPPHSVVELHGELGSFRAPDGKDTLTERYHTMTLLQAAEADKGE